LPPPDFIKLDVQGAEIDVLRGASECLRTTKYVLTEVSLHRWNKDAPMIEDVVRYMADRDFEIVDIVDMHFLDNYLFQIDVLFAHKTSNLRRQDFYA
jgi:hypothetical protein